MVFPIIEGSAGYSDSNSSAKRSGGFKDLISSTKKTLTVDTVTLTEDTDKTLLLAIYNQLSWTPSTWGYIKTYRNVLFNPTIFVISIFVISLLIGSFFFPPLIVFALAFTIPIIALMQGWKSSKKAYFEGIGVYFIPDVTIRDITTLKGGRKDKKSKEDSVSTAVDDLFTAITGISLDDKRDPEELKPGSGKYSVFQKYFNFAVYSKEIDEQGVYIITDRYGTIHLVSMSDADRYVAVQPNLEYIDIPYFFKQGGNTNA